MPCVYGLSLFSCGPELRSYILIQGGTNRYVLFGQYTFRNLLEEVACEEV